jgi:hypothetical protein
MPEALDSLLFFHEFLALQAFEAVLDQIDPQRIKARRGSSFDRNVSGACFSTFCLLFSSFAQGRN